MWAEHFCALKPFFRRAAQKSVNFLKKGGFLGQPAAVKNSEKQEGLDKIFITLNAPDFPIDSAASPTAFLAPSAFFPKVCVNSPAFFNVSFLPTSSKVVFILSASPDNWSLSTLELLLISPKMRNDSKLLQIRSTLIFN